MGISVRFFIFSDDPKRPRVIKKSDWTGWGLDFSCSLFSQVCYQRENILTVLRDMVLPRLISGELRKRMSSSHLIDSDNEESSS